MTDPIRWGVLGASDFAQSDMAPALHMARGSRHVALATRSADKAAPFVDRVPDLRVETDYDALLAADDIDAIYVPLPNHLHVEWAVKALQAGKHVLCEKPIALHSDDFDALIAARDTAGKLAAEAYMIVHHPQWQRAKALLAQDAIGRLVHVEAVFTYNNPDPENVRNQPNMGGGGLRDIGVYTFGSVRFATGQEPDTLTSSLRMEHDFDTFAEVNASFPDFTYHAIVSTRMAPRQRMVFHGEDGTLELTAPFNANVFDQAELLLETRHTRPASTQGMTRTVERWPGVNQYVLQVEAFCESARTGAHYPWTLEQARGTQAMIDRAIAGG
ncbi:Glucose--fructose oxidoreductase precursor [Rhodobacteraceae bacterium THAF1]|uniref:Gfo/Idh/MocA family protein n=1 Tax=Palleronia sp. THAF1 TaxID=2587842 RepID=UPI000F3BA836|nr:Gfo/Idh/MocA family oxidoreductase [Palleronia sp. THAF1]QFU08667.1 Glucose--fructose oxidoreductase precursor [Palleronia sp. THAF1]VDC28414.1 Glucose--fructose oxidoreductase precursor [Rhodobacteraceae bacterium THAF1]